MVVTALPRPLSPLEPTDGGLMPAAWVLTYPSAGALGCLSARALVIAGMGLSSCRAASLRATRAARTAFATESEDRRGDLVRAPRGPARGAREHDPGVRPGAR